MWSSNLLEISGSTLLGSSWISLIYSFEDFIQAAPAEALYLSDNTNCVPIAGVISIRQYQLCTNCRCDIGVGL